MDKLKANRSATSADLTLDDIRTVNGLPKVPLADLDRAADRADVLAAEAEADRAKLDAARPALLLTLTDAQLGEHDDAAAAFSRTTERAAALATALRGRAELVRAELAEAARVERYDAAEALLRAVPAAVEADYRELVRLGRSIVERIARARELTRNVNEDLPAGRPGFVDVEAFRHVPDQPRKIVSARLVKLYVDDGGRPIEDQFRVQPRWSVDGAGRPLADKSVPQRHPADLGFAGAYERDRDGREIFGKRTEVHVRRWDFVEFETVEAVRHRHVGAFAHELKIPALFDLQPPAWDWSGEKHLDGVLRELASPLGSLEPPPANPAVYHRNRLDMFERAWGPLSELPIAVEDGTADAVRRRSDNRDDGYRAFESTATIRGDGEPGSIGAITRL